VLFRISKRVSMPIAAAAIAAAASED